MKKILLIIAFIGFSSAQAANKGLGLGVTIGSPSGLSAKYWLESKKAVDFGLGWDSDSNFYFWSDYLIHFPGAFHRASISNTVVPYVGLGGYLKVFSNEGKRKTDNDDKSMRLVVRIPLGIEWLPNDYPIGVFGELSPGLKVYPNTSGEFGGAIGARFYF